MSKIKTKFQFIHILNDGIVHSYCILWAIIKCGTSNFEQVSDNLLN